MAITRATNLAGLGTVFDSANGRIGLGTGVPDARLHLKGSASDDTVAKVILEDTDSLKGVFFVESTRSGSGNRLDIGEGTDTFIRIISDNFGGNEADRGRIGIGTTPSLAELEIMQTSTRAIALGIRGRGSDDVGSLYFYNHVGDTVQGYIQGRSTDLRIDSEANTPIRFQTNGTEKVRISADGLVGIGTDAPAGGSPLHINGGSDSTSTHLRISADRGLIARLGDTSASAQSIFDLYDTDGSTQIVRFISGGGDNWINTGGYLGIGTDNPGQKLHVVASSTEDNVNNAIRAQLSGAASFETNAGYFVNTDTGTGVSRGLYVSGTDYGLWVNSGTSVFGSNIGIGASSTGVPYGITIQQGATDPYKLGWVDAGGTKRGAIFVNPANDELQFLGGPSENLGFSITSSGVPKLYGDVVVSAGSTISANNSGSEISIYSGGTHRGGQITFVAGQKSYAGLIFRSGTTGAHNEWSRLNGSGDWMWGKTSLSVGTVGTEIRGSQGSYFVNVVDDNYVLDLNRKSTDGGLIAFRQDSNLEGSISVSGSTVSLIGGHLSRFAQLLDGSRQEILRGTILSNLDELSEWKLLETQMEEIKEIQVETYVVGVGTTVGIATTSIITDAKVPYGGISDVGVTTTAIFDGKEYTGVVVMDLNEQLNRLKVSDVEGDPNVAGVFQEWDDDDGVHTQDLICAMTGDFPVRIGAGVTVTRGDLLMSAGDGTAKPQGDDIIRSKTIAKVISTVHTITYDDGTFCVPCVLMAC